MGVGRAMSAGELVTDVLESLPNRLALMSSMMSFARSRPTNGGGRSLMDWLTATGVDGAVRQGSLHRLFLDRSDLLICTTSAAFRGAASPIRIPG